jgi:uncharacterized membrane-anchored protein
MRRNSLILSAIVLAIVQIGFLSWIIAGRAAVLRDGREVIFKVAPVDPRDLLRGDYVSLTFDIDAIPHAMIENAPQEAYNTEYGTIYVRVKKGADGYWHLLLASLNSPPRTPPSPDDVDLRGIIHSGRWFGPDTTIDVDYGLDRFYLPEGEGLAIEHDMNTRPFGVKVAVAADGTAQIKALMDGETLLYEEPLY